MQHTQVSKQTSTMAERIYLSLYSAMMTLWDTVLLEVEASGASINQAIAATAATHGKTQSTLESEIIEFANMCNIKFHGNWSQAPEWILSMMMELGWTFNESKVLSPAKGTAEANDSLQDPTIAED